MESIPVQKKENTYVNFPESKNYSMEKAVNLYDVRSVNPELRWSLLEDGE